VHYDSSSYNNVGNPKGNLNQNAVGILDGADEFDGINAGIQVSNSEILNFGTRDFSYSLWVKQNVSSGPQQLLCKRIQGQNNYEIQISSIQELLAIFNSEIGTTKLRSEYVEPNKWYYVYVVRESGIGSLYVDGNLEDTGSAEQDVSSNADLFFGMDHYSGDYLSGIIDEIRISNKERTQDWIFTEYNNQNDPLRFLSFGPEET